MQKLESFFWGVIAAGGAVVFQFIFFLATTNFIVPEAKLSFDQFYVIPVVIMLFAFLEEFFKYLMLTQRITSISTRPAFFINAFLIGLGFFALELTSILANAGTLEIQKIFEIAILHLGTTLLMGYFIFEAKKSSRLGGAFYSLLLATSLHFSFNWLTLQASPLSGSLAILILSLFPFLAFKLFATKK